MKKNFFESCKQHLNKEYIIIYADLFQRRHDIRYLSEQLYYFMLEQPNKTFIIPSYTNIFFYKTKKKNFFQKKKKSKNGYFCNYLLSKKKIFRSNHPTNSFIFLGKYAKKLASIQIDFESPHKIFEYIGFNDLNTFGVNWNGSNSFHVAEYLSGISKRNIARNLVGSYYKKNNRVLWYSLNHIHGCSSVHMRDFSTRYVSKKLVLIKKKQSLNFFYSDFGKLLNFELDLLKKNKKHFMCKDKECLFCSGLNLLDFRRLISFYLRNFKKIVFMLINGMRGSLNNQRF